MLGSVLFGPQNWLGSSLNHTQGWMTENAAGMLQKKDVWPEPAEDVEHGVVHVAAVVHLDRLALARPAGASKDGNLVHLLGLQRVPMCAIQGEPSGRFLALVDIKTKVSSQYRLLILKAQLSI